MHNQIAIKAKQLKGLRDKSIGLINKEPMAVFFKTRFGIHTFGMKYPIDVVILDSKCIVVNLKENLEPNKIYVWLVIYNNVLELPENTIKKSNIKIGNKINLELI